MTTEKNPFYFFKRMDDDDDDDPTRSSSLSFVRVSRDDDDDDGSDGIFVVRPSVVRSFVGLKTRLKIEKCATFRFKRLV